MDFLDQESKGNYNPPMKRISIVVDNRTNWTKAQTIIENLDQPDVVFVSDFAREASDELVTTFEVTQISVGDTGSMIKRSREISAGLDAHWSCREPATVVALTDRFETLAVAQTAALMGFRIAHIQGGEITGTIDESVRHAVTKLSHYHFVSNLDAKKRVIAMGEDPAWVFNFGCPSVDLLMRTAEPRQIEEPYILVIMHPVTTELNNYHNTHAVLEALTPFEDRYNVVIIEPNHDRGWADVNHALMMRTGGVLLGSVTAPVFHSLLRYCSVLVGNSSAGIREAGCVGVPVVNIGSRQNGRMKGKNVISVVGPQGITQAVSQQIEHGSYEPEWIYGRGNAGRKIAEVLEGDEMPPLQKRIRI